MRVRPSRVSGWKRPLRSSRRQRAAIGCSTQRLRPSLRSRFSSRSSPRIVPPACRDAQVAYVHQHPISYVVVRGRPSLLLRERIGLGALVEITRQYLGAGGPARPVDLARTLDAPLAVLEDLIEDFVASGLLVHTAEPDGVMLARAPDHVTVVEVLGTS